MRTGSIVLLGLLVAGCGSSLEPVPDSEHDMAIPLDQRPPAPDASSGDSAAPPTVNLNQGDETFNGAWYAQVNDGGLAPVPDGAFTPEPTGFDLPDGGAPASMDPPYGVFGSSLNLWTKLGAPPYYGAASTLLRRLLDVTPRATGAITMVAKFRWRYELSDAVHPQMTLGLVTNGGEDMILQIFGDGSVLHTRFGLKMTDVLQIGVWYRLSLTIGSTPAPGTVRMQIFDDATSAEVWHSCDDSTGDTCPAAPSDLSPYQAFHISIAIDDTSAGEANIQLQDVFVQQDQP